MSYKKWSPVLAVLAVIFATCGNVIASAEESGAKAKYVFLFIGDGMGVVQRNAAETLSGQGERPEPTRRSKVDHEYFAGPGDEHYL